MRLAVSCSCKERSRIGDSRHAEKIDWFFHTAEEFEIVGADLEWPSGTPGPRLRFLRSRKIAGSRSSFRKIQTTSERIVVFHEAGDFCRLIDRPAGGNSYESSSRSADSFNCLRRLGISSMKMRELIGAGISGF